jgi:hypothetical protein
MVIDSIKMLRCQKKDKMTTVIIWDIPAPAGLQSDRERMLAFTLLGLADSIFRADCAVALDVVAPADGIALFEQFFFMSDCGKGRALGFLKNLLHEKQIGNDMDLWSLANQRVAKNV